MRERHDFWSGRGGFILATIGSAVGLGSIWKFPYEAGANGGGAFILFYLAGVALIVFPLMLAEFAIGRRGRADAARGIAAVAAAVDASPRWRLVGVLGIATAFLILSFYSVIGGWAVAYSLETVVHGLPGADPGAVRMRFDALMAAPVGMAAYHAAFMAAAAWVVARGISSGIEKAARFLLPGLVVLIIVLAVFSMAQGDVAATLRFLFAPDPGHLTLRVALDAVGLGFFSIGVGLCLMVTYAAYAGSDLDLREVALVTIVGDTAISLVAGLAVFPIVFSEGLDPAGGPGLVFITVPIAFARIPFGTAAAAGFFLLLIVAAMASAISLLEMPVALLSRLPTWTRRRAAVVSATTCWACGLATVLSFNRWSTWYPLAALPGFAAATVFDIIDHVTSNVMLPLGGLLLAVFSGWVLPARLLADEIGIGARAARMLQAVLRYVIPAGILVLSGGHLVL